MWPQFLLRLLVVFFVVNLVVIGYVAFKIKAFEKTSIEITPRGYSSLISTVKEVVSKNKKDLTGEDSERINILLLGMGGEGHSGQYLTDTIILASVNPQNYDAALIGIPRDLYVKIPETKVYTKINAVYTYGRNSNYEKPIEPVKKVVEEITGEPIDYYLTIDFEGFKKIIDELGGIIIQVENDIVDYKYPGPGRSYETFKIEKGTHLVNGDVALKYARVRHVSGGDFSRLKRQQEIISAAKRRALSLENFVNPIKLTNLLGILEENIQTDIQLDEIPAFIEIFKNINTYNMNTRVLDAWSPNSLLAVSHVLLGNVNAFILVPRTGNYQEIHYLVSNIFHLDKLEKAQERITEEAANVVLVTPSCQNPAQIKNIFSKMGYKISVKEDFSLASYCQDKTVILTENKDKIYTLNDLSTKFNAEIKEGVKNDYSADVVLCFPEREINKLGDQINQLSADEFDGGDILDNDGNILYNQN